MIPSSPQRRGLTEMDANLRDMERAVRSGDPDAMTRYFLTLLRAGRIGRTDIQLLAILGVGPAESAVRSLGDIPVEPENIENIIYVLWLLPDGYQIIREGLAHALVMSGFPSELIDRYRRASRGFMSRIDENTAGQLYDDFRTFHAHGGRFHNDVMHSPHILAGTGSATAMFCARVLVALGYSLPQVQGVFRAIIGRFLPEELRPLLGGNDGSQ
jgi:hypothetical protein